MTAIDNAADAGVVPTIAAGNDFDLFGRGSLFELISIAVTRAGRARLAAWLERRGGAQPARRPEWRPCTTRSG